MIPEKGRKLFRNKAESFKFQSLIIMHEYHYIRNHFLQRSDCTYIIFYGPLAKTRNAAFAGLVRAASYKLSKERKVLVATEGD